MVGSGAFKDGTAPDVAFILQGLRFGGVERIAFNVADVFVRRGLSVHVVTLTGHRESGVDIPEGVEFVELGGASMLTALPRLVRYQQRHRPAICVLRLHERQRAIDLCRRARSNRCSGRRERTRRAAREHPDALAQAAVSAVDSVGLPEGGSDRGGLCGACCRGG